MSQTFNLSKLETRIAYSTANCFPNFLFLHIIEDTLAEASYDPCMEQASHHFN